MYIYDFDAYDFKKYLEKIETSNIIDILFYAGLELSNRKNKEIKK